MKTTFITLGEIEIKEKKMIYCDAGKEENAKQLAMENGSWKTHLLRNDKETGFFSNRNIMIAFSHEDFPYDVKDCVKRFYVVENTIPYGNWKSERNILSIDTGKAIFHNQDLLTNEVYNNVDSNMGVSWNNNSICMDTGFGDGQYIVYSFAEEKDDCGAKFVIVDFMLFADNVEVE